jgi:sigma-B regulation protein RsbU (phosphoserine phosphatase)
VGGDGLGVFALDESRLGVYLLDVSGHGVAAALLSVALARQLPPQNNDRAGEPAEVALRLNRWLMADRANEQFFTMVYGVLDVRSLAFRYVSAGHPDLLRVSAGGEASFDTGQAIPIGIRRDAAFPEQQLQLQRGDVLVLYSDGIVESQDAGKRLFGQERLRQCVRASAGRGVDACVDQVVAEVQAWAAGSPHDDVSILAVAVGADEG